MLAISGFTVGDEAGCDEELFLPKLTGAQITNILDLETTWTGTVERMHAWPTGATRSCSTTR